MSSGSCFCAPCLQLSAMECRLSIQIFVSSGVRSDFFQSDGISLPVVNSLSALKIHSSVYLMEVVMTIVEQNYLSHPQILFDIDQHKSRCIYYKMNSFRMVSLHLQLGETDV